MDAKNEASQWSTEAPPPSYQIACAPEESEHLGQPQQHPEWSVTPAPVNYAQPEENWALLRTISSHRLQKPIAIPATSPKLGSPFLRAYAPALEQFGLPKEVFLRFVDDLNRVAVASPPLQVLGLASNTVGMVPLATAQIVGASVNAATTIGTVAISKGRTEMFLRQSNKEVFQPRGLKVEVAKLGALAKIAGMSFLDDNGAISKTTTILQPLENPETLMSMSGQDRRLQALEPWIAQLDLAPLPSIAVKDNPLSRLNAAASERQRKKEEKKMVEKRGSASKDYHKESAKALEEYEKEMAKVDKDERKARKEKSPKKMEEEVQKVEKKRLKVTQEYEKEMQKVEKDRLKDDKEEEQVRKILWLVIRNIDADDGPGPNPYVDDST